MFSSWSRRSRLCLRANPERAQTALETAFVFTSIIFLAFTVMNLGVFMHTRAVATYAGFMAARSYQVYGDQTGREAFKEEMQSGTQNLFDDMKTLSVIRTAEDIFTCALPWVMPPKDDLVGSAPLGGGSEKAGCMEGERKYESTNINKQIGFLKFDDDQNSNFAQRAQLETLTKGYKEINREPMRFAILRLQFKNRLLINPYNVFDGTNTTTNDAGVKVVRYVDDKVRNKKWHKIYVPVLLNPGLESGVNEAPQNQQNGDVDESAN